MKRRTIYTDVPQEHTSSTGEQIGMIFAMVMLFIVLPIAICILTAGV